MTVERHRIDRLSDEVIIKELQEVAKYYKFSKFTRHEFDKVSKSCKGSVVISRFGSWDSALLRVGIDLAERPKATRCFISDNDLMGEMARVFDILGHRPSKAEWDVLSTRYSYTTYKARFKGWVNAWSYFFEKYKGVEMISSEVTQITDFSQQDTFVISNEEKRNIPLKLRLKVFQRDNFKCCYCGASPATDPKVQLHIDHKTPFSKTGKTELDNLQTLCQNCNWGKGNDE